MAHEVTLLGKFLGLRAKNPDTFADPYDPSRESALELDLPNHDLTFSRPGPLPLPPNVVLSTPNALPVPPAVELSSPAVLPVELAPSPLFPSILPQHPGVVQSAPGVLPLPPQVNQTLPGILPPPPIIPPRIPFLLPPPPAIQSSIPFLLPPPPAVQNSSPAALPPPPEFQKPPPNNIFLPLGVFAPSLPADLPTPAQEIARSNPNVDCTPRPAPDPKAVFPKVTPDSGYVILPELYSPLGGAYPGNLAGDPFMYERQVERIAKGVGPGKLALHALTQVGLFAQNVYGTVWNPVLVAPPPSLGDLILPALDLLDGKTEERQTQIGSLVDSVLDYGGDGDTRLIPGGTTTNTQPNLSRMRPRTNASRAFDNAKNILVNGLSAFVASRDPLQDTAFANGIIPMRLKGDNQFGFRTFREGQGDQTTDDSVYLPLCFTDLRPIGDTFRTVYFRPIITSLNESLTPEWNKSQYYGRVDPVVTYMSTLRTINISFELVAFGPEDVKTIYQKLHWLTSMVYPEYDNNLNYRSGPVVRMRVGDVVNAVGKEGAKGLPGIIESLDYDYSESLWELKEHFKLPRHVKVSLSFTVLHDKPMGRGSEGMFGGLGQISNGIFSVPKGNENDQSTAADPGSYRKFGNGTELLYNTLALADKESGK